MFCRAVWDQEYQATLFTLAPRKRTETAEEMQGEHSLGDRCGAGGAGAAADAGVWGAAADLQGDTDLPLAVDQPVDFGMQRFCETCQACAHACPVQAIPRGERSYELTSRSNRPGILRWHVDVGKCFQFWVMNGGSLDGLSDCANCVAACPWSQQSRPWL